MKFLILLLFGCSSLFAKDYYLEVQDLNFTYQDPQGEGSASSFTFKENPLEGEIKVKVNKGGESFHFVTTGAKEEEFELKDAPDFIMKAETINVEGLNFLYANRLFLGIDQGRFSSLDDEIKLDGLELECAKDSNYAEPRDQLISGCIQQMTLKNSKFSSQAEIVKGIVSSLIDSKGMLGGVSIHSMDMKSNGGKWDLTAEVRAQISGKAKAKGSLSYDQPNGKLIIKITEVKFSFLDVTSKVFDELEKQENAKFQVDEPYVYYSIK